MCKAHPNVNNTQGDKRAARAIRRVGPSRTHHAYHLEHVALWRTDNKLIERRRFERQPIASEAGQRKHRAVVETALDDLVDAYEQEMLQGGRCVDELYSLRAGDRRVRHVWWRSTGVV
jgi:hypothetical protein